MNYLPKMAAEFYDAQLEHISQFLTATQNGMEAVQRWQKYVENGATPENDLQHSFTASLLAVVIIETIRAESPELFDAYLVLKAVLLHDIGEIYQQDTHYIDKSTDGDMQEINAFCHHHNAFDSQLLDALLEGFLLQFVPSADTLQKTERLNTQVQEKLAILQQLNGKEALIFEAIERYGYMLYAYEQFRQKDNMVILIQVLRHQQTHLQRLAQALPAFGKHFYTQSLDEQISQLLAQMHNQHIEIRMNITGTQHEN